MSIKVTVFVAEKTTVGGRAMFCLHTARDSTAIMAYNRAIRKLCATEETATTAKIATRSAFGGLAAEQKAMSRRKESWRRAVACPSTRCEIERPRTTALLPIVCETAVLLADMDKATLSILLVREVVLSLSRSMSSCSSRKIEYALV
jgi:hypothetical protein